MSTQTVPKKSSVSKKQIWAECALIAVYTGFPKVKIHNRQGCLKGVEGLWADLLKEDPKAIKTAVEILRQEPILGEAKEPQLRLFEKPKEDKRSLMADLSAMLWAVKKIGSIDRARQILEALSKVEDLT